MRNIRVLQPTIDEQTKKDLMEVLDNGWLGQGPKTAEFEKKLAEKVGTKFAVGTCSGTAALDLCLRVYDDEYHFAGGELITTPITFVSDAIIAFWHKMDLTFADVDKDSLCLDPSTIKITPKTRAIVVVNSHGRLADIKGIRDLVDKSGQKILIIEDNAHAMFTPGVCQHSDIQIWSFQAVKTMPAGDGGAVTTNDERIANELKNITWLNVEKSTFARASGETYSWEYDLSKGDGVKAYMNDIQATICIGQLRRLDEMLAKRRTIQARYNDAFLGIRQITTPEFSHTVQYYTMQCERRDELHVFLAKCGITTGVHFKPLSEMSFYKQFKKYPLPVTDSVWLRFLSLPCHDALKFEELEYIIDSVKKFYR